MLFSALLVLLATSIAISLATPANPIQRSAVVLLNAASTTSSPTATPVNPPSSRGKSSLPL